MSTATDVREAIRDAIRGIETTLGFTDGDYSGIKEYRLDHQQRELVTGYLKNDLSTGAKVTRAIAIEVLESESQDQLFANSVGRIYTITIEFYYEFGTNGSGVQTLISHMRAVRNAIKGMTTELSSTVDRVESLEQTRPEVLTVEGLDRPDILTAAIIMEAFESNATF